MYMLEVGWTPIFKQLKHLNSLRQHHVRITSIGGFEHNYYINLVSLFPTLNIESIARRDINVPEVLLDFIYSAHKSTICRLC